MDQVRHQPPLMRVIYGCLLQVPGQSRRQSNEKSLKIVAVIGVTSLSVWFIQELMTEWSYFFS